MWTIAVTSVLGGSADGHSDNQQADDGLVMVVLFLQFLEKLIVSFSVLGSNNNNNNQLML